ncbi:hypothetical protein H9Q08_00600 [Chryseobacterium sp. PS-8]|uniref:DUF4352 domain-containing protein n=1 Tax=Chryseobacterium indicum TaxID=2766954 RepID=A0ABS9C380_9FLAO|nr:hypothetical protein [Chryseobacterium sp. PS-8]MCF2217801.1 hypothetical protein [Chryseobacterium sp. PS-8]
MKKTLFTLIILLLFSCGKKQEYSPEIEAKAGKIVDSIMASNQQKANLDTKESFLDKELTKNSPVQVLKYRFVEKEYSTYKDVALTYKNVSDKTISAIRFEWYGENSFGEPADMGVSTGTGGGFTDDALKPGKTDSGQWDILSRDGKKLIGARAYEVVFEDGTKWKLNNN